MKTKIKLLVADSNRELCLQMKSFFENEINKAAQDPEVTITVETIGVRPCANLSDVSVLNEMVDRTKLICEKNSGLECRLTSGSTDANLPMSMGIPAVCAGTYMGGGMHTREEFLELESIPVGLEITAEIILDYFY